MEVILVGYCHSQYLNFAIFNTLIDYC